MEKLMIVSDIDGLSECEWIRNYCQALESKFEITLIDSVSLAGIDPDISSPEDIHDKMVKIGIKTSADHIRDNHFPQTNMIGFSIGGTILWKAMAGKVSSAKLACISSTRLRFEVATPNCSILTLYGNMDPFKPPAAWFNEKNLYRKMMQGDHDFYKTEVGIKDTIVELKRFFQI